jgi:hypothetical protein
MAAGSRCCPYVDEKMQQMDGRSTINLVLDKKKLGYQIEIMQSNHIEYLQIGR